MQKKKPARWFGPASMTMRRIAYLLRFRQRHLRRGELRDGNPER